MQNDNASRGLSLPGRGPWRTVLTGPLPGAENMAIDHVLMDRARRTGECVLRVYTWLRPTLSFGRHQAVRDRVHPDAAGGRALLHHREVTYSVTAPLGAGDSAREWYAGISAVLLDALRHLGVPAEPAVVEGRPPLPGTAPCFVRADPGEIAVGGRKLVGSALLRQDDAILQHGSILVDDDQPLLAKLLPGDEAPARSAATLREALGRAPDAEEVAGALVGAFNRAAGRLATPLSVDSPMLAEVARLQALYASDEWTFRS